MTTIVSEHVGKIWLPEMSRVTIGPAMRTKGPRYQGVISYTLRHDGGGLEKAFAPSLPQLETFEAQWRADERLRAIFPSPEAFGRFLGDQLSGRLRAWSHNERIQNGGRMLAKNFWGLTSSPQVSTVGVPSWMALNNNSAFTTGNFTYAHSGTDLSLGNGATNVAAGLTTNEYTTAGLARASATVGSFVDASALDGTFTFTVTKTFTCSSGPQSVYGMGLFDASSTATCNLFMEGAFATATLQTNDTLAVTVNGQA